MEEEPHPEWNPALEEVVKKEGEQAEALFWLHNEAASWAKRWNDWIQIPSILLATVTGFFSATSDLVPPIAIGAMSVTVGFMNTVASYYKYSQRAEGHRIASLLYLKTYKKIECQLSLPITQRVEAGALLTELRDLMERVGDTAPSLPETIKLKFKTKFAENGTAKPIEANGLDAIKIFREAPRTPRVNSPVAVTIRDAVTDKSVVKIGMEV